MGKRIDQPISPGTHPAGMLKRLLTLAAIALCWFASGGHWGTSATPLSDGVRSQDGARMAADDPESTSGDDSLKQGPTRADCRFLLNPANFRENAIERRSALSSASSWVSAQLPRSDSTLVPAQNIPQKNFIDTILFNRMQKDGVLSAPLCTDQEYIRRVTLDITGRVPSPDAVTKFLADTNPSKRDALVDSLLGTPEYVDKWTMFFGDLFKNTSRSTNVNRFPGGRDAFYQYIKDSVAKNHSYAQIASEMIAAQGDSYVVGETNFVVGGTVPMGPPQDTMDGQAVLASTVFLGINAMDCLLCHDGAGHLDAVNLWGAARKRSEAWGMSAFFARTRMPRQVVTQNPLTQKFNVSEAPNGEYLLNTTVGNRSARAPQPGQSTTVTPKYMFGGGGTLAGENRRQAFARLITSDPQFARAAVNYIWEKLMVEALVSPSNGFDPARLDPAAPPPAPWALQPSNPELLQSLAQEFIRQGYDLQKFLGLIAKSNAYQLSAQYPGTWKIDYVPYYARKYVRRLDAEEIHDAITKATGIPGGYTFSTTLPPVAWAMQLPDTVEPLGGGRPVTDVRNFLNAFQRGDRDQKLRSNEPSILQALNLMNSTFVMNRIHQGNTGSAVSKLLAQPNLTTAQIINNLYLATLSRNPTAAETQSLTPYFTSMGKPKATESIQWALLNKVDFMFNY